MSDDGPSSPQRPAMRPVAAGRREARERALHLLYEAAMKDLDADGVLGEQVLAPEPYTEQVVRGVLGHQAELDEVVGRLARGWTLDRMPVLDLAVLRLGCFELAHLDDVPTGVVLSEAADLASEYGTDDSARFVNGVLAAAAKELRPA